MSRWGHTLIELAAALSVFGLLAGVTGVTIRGALERYREHRATVQGHQSLRLALSLLPLEFRGLDAADAGGGDLLELMPNALTYRSMVNVHFVCLPPDPVTGHLTLAETPWLGSQRFDPADQSILVLAVQDSAAGERWLSYRVGTAFAGQRCPGSRGSITLVLDGSGFPDLASVPLGAPVRGYRVTQSLLYRGGDGDYWLGMKTRSSLGDWGATQPVIGPLAAQGLVFTYLDEGGAPAATPARVARVGINLLGAPEAGGTQPIAAETEVWLQNNPQPRLERSH